MISTATMIKLGKVKGNRMVDMQLSNDKLVKRAIKMLQDTTTATNAEAKDLIHKFGNVRAATEYYLKNGGKTKENK